MIMGIIAICIAVAGITVTAIFMHFQYRSLRTAVNTKDASLEQEFTAGDAKLASDITNAENKMRMESTSLIAQAKKEITLAVQAQVESERKQRIANLKDLSDKMSKHERQVLAADKDFKNKFIHLNTRFTRLTEWVLLVSEWRDLILADAVDANSQLLLNLKDKVSTRHVEAVNANITGKLTVAGNIVMSGNPLLLSSNGTSSGIGLLPQSNSTKVWGPSGGILGTASKDALLWDTNGNVSAMGDMTVGKNLHLTNGNLCLKSGTCMTQEQLQASIVSKTPSLSSLTSKHDQVLAVGTIIEWDGTGTAGLSYSNGTFTCMVPGVYQFVVSKWVNKVSGNDIDMSWTIEIYSNPQISLDGTGFIDKSFKLGVGDTIRFKSRKAVTQYSGTTLEIIYHN